MPSIGTFRVVDKKCATCAFFQGSRNIGLQANKPFYIYAESAPSVCMANNKRSVRPADRCLSWQKWEKLT